MTYKFTSSQAYNIQMKCRDVCHCDVLIKVPIEHIGDISMVRARATE